MLNKQVNSINTQHTTTMDMLNKVNPKYAKHMFLRNELIENFAKFVGGGIDILGQPVCTKCERPCAWDSEGSAYCFSCNHKVPADKVITVLDYLLEYTKTFTEKELEILNMGGGGY